ncbi:uncharacterized protein LOC123310219 [Coccinella septempunctata]|uniref:uncharacterized protein LOC123310219 n=1 Tax=Coccinella septempunctata TaxID=41139 RepID=UPI001D0753FA|nr:uncharacterized protein LOC123310219 [Coccinella septempunctata]
MIFPYIFGIFLVAPSVNMLNLLPCTENVTPQDEQKAADIIKDSTPPGYTFIGVRPEVRLGRNPHRWIGVFTENTGAYETGCPAMVYLKQQFRKLVPQGSDLSSVRIIPSTSGSTIEVEYLVNCFCTKVPRRRRRSSRCHTRGYTRETGKCSK